jgi:hypothetical protein
MGSSIMPSLPSNLCLPLDEGNKVKKGGIKVCAKRKKRNRKTSWFDQMTYFYGSFSSKPAKV